ncbi:hypothetical protein F8C82_10470 [Phaeocystidibacter marisrubri]|uniref:Uncharacterized protein n=1 Tax=Phaeocystidibacter marisrubri TaxID=1577780 RepID=A0A6L3ZEQ7_9FLAO|nr:hypothetical protein F8C82_10470 [Phaeocystidibacter marisrubri]
MPYYRLNHNAQNNGDHEVHTTTCNWVPTSNFEDLGFHLNCQSAVQQARLRYPRAKIDGCKHCSYPCHTN